MKIRFQKVLVNEPLRDYYPRSLTDTVQIKSDKVSCFKAYLSTTEEAKVQMFMFGKGEL